MSLGTIIADVTARLLDGYPTLTSAVGFEHLKENDTAPRVVWVPTADSYSGAKMQKVQPRQLHTREAGLDAHVWAKGSGGGATAELDATETLANDVIAMVHRTQPGNYRVTGGVWSPAEKTHYGRVYTISFVFDLPIRDVAYTTVVLTASTQNVGLTFPSGNTVSGTPGA